MTNDEIKHLMREQWPTAILIDADVERIRNIIEAAVLAERTRCKKVCDDLYKHDRKESGYDEGWNDALGTADNFIRSMK